jgi:hypothetical protein
VLRRKYAAAEQEVDRATVLPRGVRDIFHVQMGEGVQSALLLPERLFEHRAFLFRGGG